LQQGVNIVKLSTKGRYGVRAMLALAMNRQKEPTSLKKLSETQDISAKYLEQLLIPLKSAGLVRSVRGARGGYLLARNSVDINLYDIVATLEGPVALVDCVQNPDDCARRDVCVAYTLWDDLSSMLIDYLSGITLADLARRQADIDQRCPPQDKAVAS
jgi:Rrf2 family protein